MDSPRGRRRSPLPFVVLLAGLLVATGLFNGVGTVVAIGASDATAVATPAISAPADRIVGEGDGYLDLTVSLSAPGLSPVSVVYATANLTASGGAGCANDYQGGSGTLDFAVGETTKVVRVDIFDCTNIDGVESFAFNLSAPVNATIARASARISVVDNGTLAATPGLFVRDALVDEKAGSVSIPVLLGGTHGQASASTVTVDYTTSDAGATAGSDYTATSGTLSFVAPGDPRKLDATSRTEAIALAVDVGLIDRAVQPSESGVIRSARGLLSRRWAARWTRFQPERVMPTCWPDLLSGGRETTSFLVARSVAAALFVLTGREP